LHEIRDFHLAQVDRTLCHHYLRTRLWLATVYLNRYTPRAFADRDTLFVYWFERNPPKAEEIVRDIKHRVAELGGPLAQSHPTDKARCPVGDAPSQLGVL
jgi:hypothetical protein